MSKKQASNRRDFMKTTALGVTAGMSAMQYSAFAQTEGANDKIQIGMIGVGGRGGSLLDWVLKKPNAHVSAVCDVYAKRRNRAAQKAQLDPANAKDCTGDYKEVVARADIDAVVIATPDHWHAPIAIAAMESGKDVYCEKPMTHTLEEARDFNNAQKKTGRIVQIGSQTTSSDQWWKAKKAIQDGMIGKLLLSQGSYHRNSTEGEWNWSIDEKAGPNAEGEDFVDWEMWLGNAPHRPWDPDRFFRFRKFWDYSGGIATDLFYHVMAPLNICWPEAQFPYKVMASGGIYVFKDTREVPDTFALMAEYPGEHQVVLSSSMANDTHIPGLIRGHEGTIMMVPHGQFEGRVDHITVTAQREYQDKYKEKFGGKTEVEFPVEPRQDHMDNFLTCVKTREKPVLDADTAFKAMATIAMAVESYKQGRIMYFDSEKQEMTTTPTAVTKG